MLLFSMRLEDLKEEKHELDQYINFRLPSGSNALFWSAIYTMFATKTRHTAMANEVTLHAIL